MTNELQKEQAKPRQKSFVRRFRPLMIILALIVLILPIDAIPDFTPIAGFLDDLIAFSYLLLELIARFRRGHPGSK